MANSTRGKTSVEEEAGNSQEALLTSLMKLMVAREEREERFAKLSRDKESRYRSNSVTSPSVGETLRAAELIGDSGDADLDKGRRRAAIEVANASIRSDDLEE
nr:hypothetical protein L204_00339 [Cryptococcus depauperatus CBS 7855]